MSMKKTFLAAIIISALLMPAIAGVASVRVVSADPESAGFLTISILSPVNGSSFVSLLVNDSFPVVSFPLIYETNEVPSWVGYSVNGNSNVTVSHNDTMVEVSAGMDNNYLTLYANDTSGNWATPQIVSFSIARTLGTAPPPNTVPSPAVSPTPTPPLSTPNPTFAPTLNPTPTPSSSPIPIPTIIQVKTLSGAIVDLAITGNITSAQMSNVTITSNQSASTTTVSFALTGENGTIGFGNVTVPINAVPYGTTPTIYIDNQAVQNQGYTQDPNNYYIWYATHFSTHQIFIVFTTTSSSTSLTAPEFPEQLIIFTIAISVVVVLSFVIIHKKL